MNKYPLDPNILEDQNFDPINPQPPTFGDERWWMDVAMGIPRGIAQAGEEIYNMADWLTGDDILPDVPDGLGLGKSRTLAGGLVSGVTQFVTAFIPIYGAMGLATKAAIKGTKLASKISASKNFKRAVDLGTSTVAGAITDFSAFDPFEERLSDLIQKFPELENPVTEWLASDEDNSEAQERIKMLLEGVAMGGILEPFIWGLRALKGLRKGKMEGADPAMTIEEVNKRYQQDSKNAEPIEIGLEENINSGEKFVNDAYDGKGPSLSDDTKKLGEGEVDEDTLMGGTETETPKTEADDGTPTPPSDDPPEVTDLPQPDDVPQNWGETPSDRPDPARGDKPPNAIFRWEGWIKKHAHTVKAVIRAEDPETLAELETIHKMSHGEILDRVNELQQFLRDLGIDPLSDDQIANLDLAGQLENAAAQQTRLRGMIGDYSELVSDLHETAMSSQGNLHDLVRFDLARKQSQQLLEKGKRNQEKIGQLLSAQKAKAPSVVEKTEILNTLRATEDEKFVLEYVQKLGGGDEAAGRRMLEASQKRYDAAVKLGNKVTGIKYLADNPTGTQRFIEYWMNGILSGPVTHAINATSNALNTFFLVGEKVAGGVLKLDTDEMRQGVAMFSYLYRQNTESLKAAGIAFKTEEDILDPLYRTVEYGASGKAGESKRALSFENPVGDFVGKVLNLPSRLLLTSDVYFRTLNYRAMSYAGIVEEAMKEGKSPEWIARRFDRIIQDGQFYSYQNIHQKAYSHAVSLANKRGLTEGASRERAIYDAVSDYKKDAKTRFDPELGALANYSIDYARRATWTQSLHDPHRHGLVKFFGTFQKIANDYPLFRLIVPFVRTPVNLLAHLMDRTLGAWMELGKIGYSNIKLLTTQDTELRRILKAGGEAAEDLHGRLATGATLMGMGYMAYSNGYLTGGGPSDPEVARAWRAAGNVPYSFKLPTGLKLEYRRFDPWAPFLGILSDIGDIMSSPEITEEDQNIAEGIASALTIAVSNGIGSRSVLTGLARISNVFSDPTRHAQSWLQQTSTTLLPFSGAAGQILAPAMEMEIRSVVDAIRVKLGLGGETWSETIGGEVEKKFTVLGEPIDTKNISPYAPMIQWRNASDNKNLDLYEEMANLNYGFEPLGMKQGGEMLTNHKNSNNVSAYTRANELMNTIRIKGDTLPQSIRNLINSDKYREIKDSHHALGRSPKVNMMRYIQRQFRVEVLEKIEEEFPTLKDAWEGREKIGKLISAGIDIPEELLATISME